MGLNDVMKRLSEAESLNTERFAEEVTITVPGEASSRTMFCTIESANTLRDGQYVDSEVERISVRCGRDEASDKGGIATPIALTTLRRSGDAAEREYVYQGEITEQFSTWHTLVFERSVIRLAGQSRAI